MIKKITFASMWVFCIVPMLFWSNESSAFWRWSREYRYACLICHDRLPQRNGVGEAFRQNGHRMPCELETIFDVPTPFPAPLGETIGNLKKLSELISSQPDLVFNRDKDGNTYLHFAIGKGYKNVPEFLLDNGAKVNAKNNNGDTPLHFAAERGNGNMVKFLLGKGADINAKTNGGITPLLLASLKGRKDVVEALLAAGASVYDTDKSGHTPLHFAAGSGNMDIAALMVVMGVNVNARDRNNATPLHYAAQIGDKDMAEFLLAHGANINARDKNGNTPLSSARLSKFAEPNFDMQDWLSQRGGTE